MFKEITAWVIEWPEWLQIGASVLVIVYLVWGIGYAIAGVNRLIGEKKDTDSNLVLAWKDRYEKLKDIVDDLSIPLVVFLAFYYIGDMTVMGSLGWALCVFLRNELIEKRRELNAEICELECDYHHLKNDYDFMTKDLKRLTDETKRTLESPDIRDHAIALKNVMDRLVWHFDVTESEEKEGP